MLNSIDIAVVDNHPLFRQGVCHTLKSWKRCNLVAQGTSHDDAIQIAQTHKPHVMLMDINLPGGGINTLQLISNAVQAVKTIMFTVAQSEADLSASFKAGAKGYIAKEVQPERLVDIVQTVHEGGIYTDPTFAAGLLADKYTGKAEKQDQFAILTPRETEILLAVSKGLTNKEVALLHSVTEKTVKGYMTSILHKLSARNRVEAALIARKGRLEERVQQAL